MKVLDPLRLAQNFDKHTQNLPSAHLVASEYRSAFESWFRVEMAQSILQDGTAKPTQLIFNFGYPNMPSKKSDICFDEEIVFELKCFCYNADSNKKHKFPEQVGLLESHVDSNSIRQGICFITLQGYSTHQRNAMLEKFFGQRPHWNLLNPRAFMSQTTFYYTIAEYHKTALFLATKKGPTFGHYKGDHLTG